MMSCGAPAIQTRWPTDRALEHAPGQRLVDDGHAWRKSWLGTRAGAHRYAQRREKSRGDRRPSDEDRVRSAGVGGHPLARGGSPKTARLVATATPATPGSRLSASSIRRPSARRSGFRPRQSSAGRVGKPISPPRPLIAVDHGGRLDEERDRDDDLRDDQRVRHRWRTRSDAGGRAERVGVKPAGFV